jgi:hypothetical protein
MMREAAAIAMPLLGKPSFTEERSPFAVLTGDGIRGKEGKPDKWKSKASSVSLGTHFVRKTSQG